jgi:hypothetical protein
MPENTTQAALPALFNSLGPREDIFAVFFELLWEKTHHTLAGVRIPDTIMLNHSRAIHWYFTAKDGTVKMRSKKKLSGTIVHEHFSKVKASASGASTWLAERGGTSATGVDMEAIAHADLPLVLADGRTTGLMQTFVDPKREDVKSTHHNIISVNWTPNVLYLEKRQNTNELGDARVALHDRTTLAETSPFVRVVPLVSTHTTATLERLSLTVVKHIEANHRGCKVTNLVLHVKIDEQHVPWVLFCTALRVMHVDAEKNAISATLAAKPTVPAAPADRRAPSTLSPHRAASDAGSMRGSTVADGDVACDLCGTTQPRRECTVVALRHVLFPLSVVSFFGKHPPGTLFTDAVAPGVVPDHVLLLHHGMLFEDYDLVKDMPEWLDRRVALCEPCGGGLENITTNLKVDKHGMMRVPATGPPPARAAPNNVAARRSPSPAAAQSRSASGSRRATPVNSGKRRTSSAAALPPLPPRSTSSQSQRKTL